MGCDGGEGGRKSPNVPSLKGMTHVVQHRKAALLCIQTVGFRRIEGGGGGGGRAFRFSKIFSDFCSRGVSIILFYI